MQNFLFFVTLLFSPTAVAESGSVERLSQLVRADLEIAETASVKAVSCSEYACRITFLVKGDGSNFQLAVFRFVQANPEFGSGFKLEDDRNDPRLAIFVIYKENIPL